MPRFLDSRDKAFIRGINNELINSVIDTPIILYKLDPKRNEPNIYGEVIEKYWSQGYEIKCIIEKETPSINMDVAGYERTWSVRLKFNRGYLMDLNIFPEIGDAFRWNDHWFEIKSVNQYQNILTREDYSLSVIVEGITTSMEALGIKE
jgi:hypothetical protein